MIEIKNGLVLVDGIVTQDPTLIGYALLDFVEQSKDNLKTLVLKDWHVFAEIELIKAKAIQEYLLSRGANDEKINDKIRRLELKIVKEE